MCTCYLNSIAVATIREQSLFISAHLEVRLLFESGD